MSGILEKLHLKHPAQPAAGHPIAGQPLAGQQFVGQPLVGQTTLVGQPLVGQQTSYVQTTGVPFTNVGQPLMAGQTSYSSTTTTSSISGGSLAGTSYVQQPLMTGLPLGAQQTSFTSWDQVYTGQSFPMGQFGYPRLTREQKASRFEQKAMEWERRGDLRKAQKNREKALRHRQFLAPGYVAQPRPQNYYTEKLQRLDQKHQFYTRNGNTLKAQRAQQRSMRLRQKHTFLQTFVGQSSMAMQHETIVKPAIIQETVRTDRIVEVQPVIHKEIDQTIVHHVEKHITEAPAANRGGVVQMAPIIQETVVRHEVDEIQPVVHREIATAVVERVEEHKSERLVAPTQHTNQVVYDNSGALAGGLVKTTTTITSWDQVYTGQSFPMGQFGYPRLTREQKASRFEQKAMEWERRGDLRKAQKNREKALRHRQFLAPGYVAQPRPQNYYMDKLHRLDQQNQLYTRNGNTLKAQRAQQRSMRLRQKHNLPHEKFPLSSLAPGLAAGGPLPSGRAF